MSYWIQGFVILKNNREQQNNIILFFSKISPRVHNLSHGMD